jgi:hypothetical protein
MSDRPAAAEASLVLDGLADMERGGPDLTALIDEARHLLSAGDEAGAWDRIEVALARVEAHWLPAARD